MNTSWGHLSISRLSLLSGALALSWVEVGSSQEKAPTVQTGLVTFVAHDYRFSGPDRIPGGMTTVQLINRGQDLLQIQFIKLPAGKTAADFITEITADPSHLPGWAQRRGGPNSVIPGEQAVAIIDLDPGAYVVICGIPDKHGRPHVLLGMLKTIRVETPVTPPRPMPRSDLTGAQVDFGFELSQPIRRGTQTIHVLNKGSQAHEVVVVKLAPGASVADFIDSFVPGVPVLPAGKPMGGIAGLERGRDGFFFADFEPGRYGLICFLPDMITGAPHFARGMMMDLTVQ